MSRDCVVDLLLQAAKILSLCGDAPSVRFVPRRNEQAGLFVALDLKCNLFHRMPYPIRSEIRCYDDAIAMARIQVRLEPELERRARKRATELGISLAEYVRCLVARDLSSKADVSNIFDLGRSGRSNIASNKHAMIDKALDGQSKLRCH